MEMVRQTMLLCQRSHSASVSRLGLFPCLTIRRSGTVCTSSPSAKVGQSAQACPKLLSGVAYLETTRLRLLLQEGVAHASVMPLSLYEDATALTLVVSIAATWLFVRVDRVCN